MPRIETLIDAYVDANIILIIGFLVWSLGRATLNRTRFGQDHLLHLRLTEGMILAAIISPILAALLARAGAVFFPGISLSAADIALAQYLNGHVSSRTRSAIKACLAVSTASKSCGLTHGRCRGLPLFWGPGSCGDVRTRSGIWRGCAGLSVRAICGGVSGGLICA